MVFPYDYLSSSDSIADNLYQKINEDLKEGSEKVSLAKKSNMFAFES